MKMVNLNKISYKIEAGARKFVSGMAKGDALAPIILLEAAVTGGRTYQAHKRGGFVESRERATEETVGAIFWFGGVIAFNKMGDAIGKKLLKLKHVNFDVGKDAVRNPLENYIAETAKYGKKALAAFKLTKVVTSILLANAFVGFVVPKINQKITANYQKSVLAKKLKEKNNSAQSPQTQTSFENFVKKETPKVSFAGMGGIQTLLSLTNNFENDSRYKLLSTDVGIAGGRGISARNKYERREVLFRDIVSIYFYMFCRKHLNGLLNFIEQGKTTRLDPVSTQKLTSHIGEKFKSKINYSAEEFEKLVFGNKNAEIPAEIKSKIQNGIISLEEFKKSVGKDSKEATIAERMSKLQPSLKNGAILTEAQLKDVYSEGLINKPEFLNEIFEEFTGKKSTDPMKFVAEDDLRQLKSRMVDYVETIIKKAKASGEGITLDTLKKFSRKNFWGNAFNLGVGFAVSGYFLSTVIPKVQYWMTKKQTGNDKFPGVEKYKK